MAKARFAYDNLLLASGVVVTSSSEVTNRPDDFLVNQARWKKWRSATATGDQWVKFDLGSAQSFQAALLVDWLAHTGGAIKVQANATDVWTSPSVDQSITLTSPNPTKVIGHWFSSVQNYRWIRIFFDNTAAANEYVELGVAFVGPYFQPTYNLVDGFAWRRVDPSLTVAAEGGEEETQERQKFYQTAGRFLDMPEADRDAFDVMFEAVGRRKNLFFGTDPDAMRELVYGRFAGALDTQHAVGALWNIPVDFMEVR